MSEIITEYLKASQFRCSRVLFSNVDFQLTLSFSLLTMALQMATHAFVPISALKISEMNLSAPNGDTKLFDEKAEICFFKASIGLLP